MSIILFLMAIALASSQNSIQLGDSSKITLKAKEPRSYLLTTNQTTVPNNTHLFIVADPLLEIPNQIPSISIKSADGSPLSCFTASNEMEGLCRIESSQIPSGLTITAECVEDCVFWLSSYFNEVFSIELDNQYGINHKTTSLSVYQFQLKVPDLKFDELILDLAFSKQTAKEGGAEMYVNVGNQTSLMPDQKNYKYKAVPQHAALALSVPHSAAPSGTYLKIAVYTSTLVTMKLKANLRTDNIQTLSLGGQKYDILAPRQEKVYKFQSGDYYKQLSDYNIDVALTVYSGHPEVKVSFDSSFNSTLENNGVGGKLNYLLTGEIRDKFNFDGNIYIKAQAYNVECSFTVEVRAIQKEYIYMKEANNYLSFIGKDSLQNYIFDYQQDLPSNTSDAYQLHFTVKVQMLEGAAYYYSRICNKDSSADCLVDVKGLQDKSFVKEVDDFPGEILHYYSIYEIFQWCQLKQCVKQQLTNTTNRYRCKIHIVGYNSQPGQLTWALTIYSRQHNIQLTEAVPFKDKVNQDTYNYYSFTPPTDQYELIVIFLTLLTGDAEIISSLNYPQPEHIFASWDTSLKIGRSNQIIYKKQEATSSINIGVYGDTTAQYLLHVVITRDKQQSAISLLPQIGQLFRVSTDRESMSFKLSPNSPGDWVVGVSAIQGDTYFVVYKGSSSSGEALTNTSSSGDSTYILKANSTEYLLVVYRANKGQSKVIISYSPIGACKIMPLGNPSFVSISPNQTECLQYVIHETPMLIAYSKNILSTLDNNFSVELYINDHFVASLKQHYHFLALESVQALCSQNLPANNDVCRLKVEMKATQLLDLDITVVAVAGEIPLYGGVVLPFSREDIDQLTPLYFYYQITDQSNLLLSIKSFTYDQYSIEWSLVEQLAYLNSKNNEQIYPALGQGSGKTNSITEYHRNVAIKISSKDNKCQNCILLVAIYATSKVRFSVLQLQILNQQIELRLGQTRKGKIAKSESILFKMVDTDKESSILSLPGYEKTDCYVAKLRTPTNMVEYQQVVSAQTVLEDSEYEVEIIGISKTECDFQVSLFSSKFPIRIMNTYSTYWIQLKDKQGFYFVYYHSTNSSFKIYEIIEYGSLYSYAAPLKGITLQKALEAQEFVFGSASPYEDLLIDSNNKNFCFNCNYLIKIVGNPSASFSMGISDPHNPVYLQTKGIVREKLQKNQSSYYEYFSYESFMIRVNVISGSLKIKVKDIAGDTLYTNVITSDEEIQIQQSETYFFLIEITTDQPSTYILQVLEEQGVKLIEGVPYEYLLLNYSTFVYTHNSNESINLIIISGETQKNEQLSDVQVTATVTVIKKDKKKEIKAMAVKLSDLSGNIASFSIAGQAGRYSLVISTPHNVTTKLLITRNQLTYLPLQTQLIGKTSNIYEISTNSNNIMLQVFVCRGTVKLQATNAYSQLQQQAKPSLLPSSVITLEHNNLAGHYVVNSQSEESLYYVLVNGSSDSVYRVVFDYIGSDLPYKYFFSVDYSVQYQLKNGSIEIYFQVPQPKELKKLAAVSAQFEVAYSLNVTDLKIFQQCLTNSVKLASIKKNIENYPNTQSEYETYPISAEDVSQIFLDGASTFFVSIKVIINAVINGQSKILRYIYEPVQISMSSFEVIVEKKQEGSKIPTVLIWVFLPLVIAGLIVLLAFKCCWRYFHLIRSKAFMLEEQEMINEEVGPSFEAMQQYKKNRIQT